MKQIIPFGLIFVVCLVVVFVVMGRNPNRTYINELKRQCGPGLNCECFANVIENRLSNNEVKVFSKFLKTLDIRRGANILEFTDEQTAAHILTTVSICRNTTDSQNNNTKQKAKK